jgi:hypothetical protein
LILFVLLSIMMQSPISEVLEAGHPSQGCTGFSFALAELPIPPFLAAQDARRSQYDPDLGQSDN